MTDRELLELAAKAAGVELQPMEVKNVSSVGDDRFIGYMVSAEKWPRGWFNPLTDDGDALRLAVKLRLEIERSPYKDGIVYVGKVGELKLMEEADETQDILEATRRAIVRAAAEIWREKE